KPLENRGDLTKRNDIVHRSVPDRAFWHVGNGRVSRILRNRQTTARLDRQQAGGSAVQVTREYHSDHSRAIRGRSSSKQRIDRGAVSVFFRSTDDLYVAGTKHEVVVGGRHIDAARRNFLSMDRVIRLKRAAPC